MYASTIFFLLLWFWPIKEKLHKSHFIQRAPTKKNLTSCRPIVLAILVEITSWKVNMRTSFFNMMGSLPKWKRTIYTYLNENLPERWIGHGEDDSFLMKWLPWSLNLFPCDFFLWGYVKGLVYVPHLFQLSLMNSSSKSLPHWIMLLETCYSVFGKSLTTDLTYVASSRVRILDTY